MPSSGHILLVDDDRGLADSVKIVLESRGYQVTHCLTGEEGLRQGQDLAVDLVLTDFRMPGMGGMALLEALKKARPRLPVVLMTAFSTTDRVIEATRKGAFDYLIKPFDMPRLLTVITEAMSASRLLSRTVTLGGQADHDQPGDHMIGVSAKMQEVLKAVGRIAALPVNVLIQGETGTGKELVARALWQHSPRADRPFVAINCSAIPDNLIESELFGHERGAFTHAVARRIGRFEQADGGTLLLDEIGDLPWQTQVKLLRVLQEQTITRVGGEENLRIDVRILSATHRDLSEMLSAGRFREDLYYRLSGAVIHLPPVRERQGDVPRLVDYLLGKASREFGVENPTVQAEAMRLLETYLWPGNIRQLENVLRKLLADARGLSISAESVRQALQSPVSTQPSPSETGSDQALADYIRKRLQAAQATPGEGSGVVADLMETLEAELYRQAVALAHGNQSLMAQWLGVSRLTVREKLDKYHLFPKRRTGAN